jgi:hypothetical protein
MSEKTSVLCRHTYYYHNSYISLSESGKDDLAYTRIVNLKLVDEIWATEYAHKLLGEVQYYSYLIVFGKAEPMTHFPVLAFKIQDERDKYLKKLQEILCIN